VLGKITEAGAREVCAERSSVERPGAEGISRDKGARTVLAWILNPPADEVEEIRERVASMGLESQIQNESLPRGEMGKGRNVPVLILYNEASDALFPVIMQSDGSCNLCMDSR
jgi:hypothetical protein